MSEQQQLLDPGKAAARPDARRELDAYLTPARATAILLERTPELRGQTLLDPCCGDGRMARQILEAPTSLRRRFARVHLNDVHEGRLEHAEAALADVEGVSTWRSQRDAADPGLYVPAPCWVVSNPPFNAAGAIVHQALRGAARGVAMLLRSTWLEPCGSSPKAPRGDRRWLVDLPPTRQIILGRVSFNGAGSDSAGCIWAIWLREPGAPWRRGSIEIVGKAAAAQLGLGVR